MALLGGFLDSLTSAGERAEAADERLESVASVSSATLRSPPTVETVAEVNEHADTGDPILVPVVTCPLDTESQPPMDAVFRYVAAVCDRLRAVYADDHVRQFDVRFEFGPDRLVRSRECRRVTVPPELAEKLADPGYDHSDLGADLEDGDDGDSVTPPVVWGECVSYTSGNAAAAGAATAAGAGGCGGAGGGC
ncbi:hypothetical protein [Halorientalis salina]|uniref:hypothetical protein n=1 Tax=Halorientalis salina TaxID=2932266 RepID=UPI0010AC437C|nr:hypothetical protein [Halorientalis salina]